MLLEGSAGQEHTHGQLLQISQCSARSAPDLPYGDFLICLRYCLASLNLHNCKKKIRTQAEKRCGTLGACFEKLSLQKPTEVC